MHLSIPKRCLLFGALSLLLLRCGHCAKILSAGDPCSGPETCGVDLACVPESPGSSTRICQAINDCRTFGCSVEQDECICTASTDCLPGEFNFTSLEECQQFLSKASLCDQARCPRVWCGPNLQYTPEGECCPVCPPEPSISFSPVIINSGCIENGTHYDEGETWQRDPCVTCTCEAGLPLCSYMQCLAPPCANPVQLPDQCCPVCLSQSFVPSVTFVAPNTDCEYDGKVYEDGSRWVPANAPCKTCFCEQGETLCMSIQCATPDCESPVYSPDICCPVCPESGDEIQADVTTQPAIAPTPLPHSPTSSSITYSPDPTPPPEIPTQIPTAEPPTLKRITTCKDNSGAVWQNGGSWCPTPYLMATCNLGVITYTQHPCGTPSCTNPTWTAGSCNCPVCPDEEEVNSVEVVAVLELSHDIYLTEEEGIRKELDAALSAAGLKIVEVKSSEYSSSQTHLVISAESPSGDMTPAEENELETLLTQIDALLISFAEVSHLEDVPSSSKMETTDTDAFNQPPQRQSQGASTTTAIVAVTVSIVVAVVSAIVIALLITHVWRRHQRPKTTIV